MKIEFRKQLVRDSEIQYLAENCVKFYYSPLLTSLTFSLKNGKDLSIVFYEVLGLKTQHLTFTNID